MIDADPTMESLRRELADRTRTDPGRVRTAWVPYRVCPLGAHVDHQLGTVTAMALDRGVSLAYAPTSDGEVRLTSRDYPGEVRFALDAMPARPVGDWGDLAQGAALALGGQYPLDQGLVGLLAGELQGGISSSAAVGVACLLALEAVNGLSVAAAENIELDRRIENDYLGLRNGILDQAAVLLSRRGCLTRIYCRTAGHETIPAPPDMPPFRILLAFSGLEKALVGTDYNLRVGECAEAARDLLAAAGRPEAAPVLGHLTADEYEAHKGRLRPAPARRAAHFFSEMERVRLGVAAWRRGDLARFGDLMTASGASSIRDYECGSPPLIDLYETLIGTEGVYGARFSGAGFRGCCVALADVAAAGAISERVSAVYARLHPDLAGRTAVIDCGTADGAGIADPAPDEAPMTANREDMPRSIAIAGAWGYIGRKFLDVALARGLETYVYDPGPAPEDVDLGRLARIEDEATFYDLDAEMFHLAVHPEHRRLAPLLGREDPPLVLVEKPMAEPGRPEDCRRVLDAVAASNAIVLYDFPELYDPITARILEYLAGFREVSLTSMVLRRSKDREDPANSRNSKRMVDIQYQETVHCLAFALHVIAAVAGGIGPALDGGLWVEGESEPYVPPNPDAYPAGVDGKCTYEATIGGVRIVGLTDFKAGTSWAKRRTIKGVGDGRPFAIDASYLEGEKGLSIEHVDQHCDPTASSYEGVLATSTRWARRFDRSRIMDGPFPNPRFARMTYQLSSALWRSCRDRTEVAFASGRDLERWDAGFATTPRDDPGPST